MPKAAFLMSVSVCLTVHLVYGVPWDVHQLCCVLQSSRSISAQRKDAGRSPV